MEKLKLHTPDLTAGNIEKLAALFPNCVTETADEKTGQLKRAIDFDQLRQELSDHLVEGPRERYHLDWPGKREALLAANAPIAKTLRPCREDSVNFDTTKNLFIEGDNLDALKLLQQIYLGLVKVIYIDPPYNTGNDLIYDDDFTEKTSTFFARSNQIDQEGNRLSANLETNGRFHSDWLTMMYARLKRAWTLLANDGVICVSISDIELANTRLVLNEIFGERNYVNTVSVVAKVAAGASGGGEDKRLKKNIEFVLVYAKQLDDFNTLAHLYTKRPLMDVIAEMRDSDESWKYTSILIGADERQHVCTTTDGEGAPIEIYKRKNVDRTTITRVCRDEGISEEAAYRKYFDNLFSDTNAQTSIRQRVINAAGNLADGEILEVEYVPRSGRDKGKRVTHSYISNTIRRVIWLSEVAEVSGGEVIKKEKLGTLWDAFDYNNVGKEGGVPFPDGKKPIDLIATCLKLYNKAEGLFMDFFAGSCSTAHAVMMENASDQGRRRFIVVQVPQKIDSKNKQNEPALKFYAENGIESDIAEVGKERLRRAGREIASQNQTTAPDLDIGFRVLKVDTSNMNDVYYAPDALKQDQLALHTDNIKQDRTPEDLLFQVLVDWGVDLALPIEQQKIAGKTVFFVDNNALAACFDPNITEDLVKDLAKRKPLRAVFRDSSYASDSTKINVAQIFKLLSPETEVKGL
jgi:adenine-specific DNA-methyltransferase